MSTFTRPLSKSHAVVAGTATNMAGVTTPALAEAEAMSIVTAAKRSQSPRDVSTSVTALNEDQLRIGDIKDISRLEHPVPGLRFRRSGHKAGLAMRDGHTNKVSRKRTGHPARPGCQHHRQLLLAVHRQRPTHEAP